MYQTPSPRPGLVQIGAALSLSHHHLELIISTFLEEPDPPPKRRGQQPLEPWRKLCAVLGYLRLPRATVRHVGAVVGMSRSAVSRALAELLPLLAERGLTQPDGSTLHSGNLTTWLAELAASGEVVVLDGTFTQVPRPPLASQRRLLYQVKSGTYCYQSLVLSTTCGDLLALSGGWPGKIHELDILDHASFLAPLRDSGVRVLGDRGFRGGPARTGVSFALPIGRWATRHTLTPEVQSYNVRQNSTRAPAEHANASLKHWGIMRFTRLPIWRFAQALQAVAGLIMLLRYGRRIREGGTP